MLSNTLWTREFHEEVFRRDGVLDLLDGAVYTSEIAWTKPHPEAFRAAMAAVGVDDPAACVFVGDRPFDDIHGAKEVGMRAVLVPHSAIPPSQHGHTIRASRTPSCAASVLRERRWPAGRRSAAADRLRRRLQLRDQLLTSWQVDRRLRA